MAAAGAIAVAGGTVAYAVNAWPRLENDTLDVRFAVRGPAASPPGVVVVGIDDRTFDPAPTGLGRPWPLPRRYDAAVIRRLRADGAKVIAFDVQFTEPTDPTDDNALYAAIRRAGNVVLATTEVSASGQTNVLGGEASLRSAHAVAAAANMPANAGGVIRSYPYRIIGLKSFAVATAQAAGRPIAPDRFPAGHALIDFPGGPGTVRTVSFGDVYRGRVDPRVFAGKVVVVGASAPTLQDLHWTSTTSTRPMSGPEIQADAIWTALRGNPLRPAPAWLGLLALVIAGLVAPLVALRWRVLFALLASVLVAALYLVAAQFAFQSGLVLSVSYPAAAWTLGLAGMVVASYTAAFSERNAFSRRLRESQVELVQRLAHAVESRDVETGEHTHRIGLLCRRLALEIGWSEAEAETLMYASVAHDIGKIGIPDRILLKPGPLEPEEWETMKTHTTIGGQLLTGSPNPLLQMAETIALSHHERWDGTGYPAGLAGDEIPLPGRICAIADVYDALLSNRPYKRAWQLDDVLAEIERSGGTQFDPALVAAFLRIAPRTEQELASAFTAGAGGLTPLPAAPAGGVRMPEPAEPPPGGGSARMPEPAEPPPDGDGVPIREPAEPAPAGASGRPSDRVPAVTAVE
ncbi:MAG TPA: CHASE2 domain-containing protein [Solirubrobacteraceae bacterium]|nr:CHASE2 domain-containing protein [Solirubrobacteraceae bacterium]